MRLVLVTPLDGELLVGRPLRSYVEQLPLPGTDATVVLDPRCPLLPADFVADLVARTTSTGRPHVGVRPVTDTLKEVGADGVVGRTIDRDSLVQLVGPLVLPAGLEPVAPVGAGLVDVVLAVPGSVVHVEAPALARRLGDVSEIALMETLAQSIR